MDDFTFFNTFNTERGQAKCTHCSTLMHFIYFTLLLHIISLFYIMLHPSGAKNDVSITSKSRRPRLQQEASIRIGQEAKKEDQQVEAVLAQP